MQRPSAAGLVVAFPRVLFVGMFFSASIGRINLGGDVLEGSTLVEMMEGSRGQESFSLVSADAFVLLPVPINLYADTNEQVIVTSVVRS